MAYVDVHIRALRTIVSVRREGRAKIHDGVPVGNSSEGRQVFDIQTLREASPRTQ
jgi:hypothetical protein